MLQWLRTTAHFNPDDDTWQPNFLGRDHSGYSTIVNTGQGDPWFGVVCAPDASWAAWSQQAGQGRGPLAVLVTLDDAIAEALRLGGTEEAARVAWVACDEE